MRKFLLLLVCIFGFMNVFSAECDNAELKKLNTLANYIEYSYAFNENTSKFDITFINVPEELYIVNDFKRYDSNNGNVVVTGIDQGSDIKYEVYSSINAECVTQYLRVIRVNVPYLNNFFGSNACSGYENMSECNNKFLNYELTEAIFKRRISDENDRRKNQNEINDPNDIIDVSIELTFFERGVNYIKEYYIPVILVIVSSVITLIICNIIYRKVKHGI